MTDIRFNEMGNLCGIILAWIGILTVAFLAGAFIYHVIKILKND